MYIVVLLDYVLALTRKRAQSMIDALKPPTNTQTHADLRALYFIDSCAHAGVQVVTH